MEAREGGRPAEHRTVVERDGVRLAVREWGPGADRAEGSVLLLHGLASTSHIFDLVAPRLARDLRVVAYDQRGHGESSKPPARYGFEHTATDAAAVIARCRLGRPVVVGHSWGANVALEVGVRYPRRVAGIVLLDGGFLSLRDRMTWAEARERLAPPELVGTPVEDFLGVVRGMFASDGVSWTPPIEAAILSLMRVDRRGRIRPRLSRRNHMRIARAMWQQDPPALLRRIRVPTLVLAATGRNPSPQEARHLEAKREAEPIVRAIGEPVSFEWIRGIHDVPLERPEAVARRIRGFVERTS